jgi:hypothetical protein
MIQKYKIIRDDDNGTLIIEEFAVIERVIKNMDFLDLNDQVFSFVCKEEYDTDKLKAAVSTNRQAIVSFIRTHNMFPIGNYATVIADSITDLYRSNDRNSIELIFDDQELLR